MTTWWVKTSIVAAMLFCILAAPGAWAQQGTTAAELEKLKRTMEQVLSENRKLNKRVQELETAVSKQEQDAKSDVKMKPPEQSATKGQGEGVTQEEEAKSPADLAGIVNDYLELGGAIEMQTGWSENFEGSSSSDIELSSADFDFAVRLNDWIEGELAVEFDSDEDKLTIDEAFITIGNLEEFPLYLQTGKLTVPFTLSTGATIGDALTISDPLTFDVFETKETVVMIGAEHEGFAGRVYAFNGDTQSGSEDHIKDGGVSLAYTNLTDGLSYLVGFDVLSSVMDTDGLSEEFPDALSASPEPAYGVKGTALWNGFSLNAEYLSAFSAVGFVSDDEPIRIKPKAWQVELGYTTDVFGRSTFAAIGYSETDNLGGAFPETRIATTGGVWIWDHTRFRLEYAYDKDYDVADGGTGNNASAVTAELTYEW